MNNVNPLTPLAVPNPPAFADVLVTTCENAGDFRAILFEWYKYAGILTSHTASILPASPCVRDLPPLHYAILTGLLLRIARLIRSNLHLSESGGSGDSTRLLDRCIIESAIKVSWLCQKDDVEYFHLYVANGVKNDLKLRDEINAIVAARAGTAWRIESRMLVSIERTLKLSGMTEGEVNAAKRLPDFNSMCRALGMEDLAYIVLQRMGSHAVHGTFTDLLTHHLEHNDEGFSVRHDDIPTVADQYIGGCHFVAEAIQHFLDYVRREPDDLHEFYEAVREMREGIDRVRRCSLFDFATAPESIKGGMSL